MDKDTHTDVCTRGVAAQALVPSRTYRPHQDTRGHGPHGREGGREVAEEAAEGGAVAQANAMDQLDSHSEHSVARSTCHPPSLRSAYSIKALAAKRIRQVIHEIYLSVLIKGPRERQCARSRARCKRTCPPPPNSLAATYHLKNLLCPSNARDVDWTTEHCSQSGDAVPWSEPP